MTSTVRKARASTLKKKLVKKALRKCGGKVASAAKKLGCTRDALYKYLRREPKMQAYLEYVRECIVDEAESELVKAVKRGEPWAVKYFLNCLGKARGFIEKSEVNISGELTSKLTVAGIREAIDELKDLGSDKAINLAERASDSGEFRRMVSPYWIMAKHLRAINRELAKLFYDDVDYRILVVEAPPRHGKSELISKHLPAWFLTREPTKRVILCSYEANYAMSWGRKVRDLVNTTLGSLGLRVRPDVKASYDWELDEYGGGMTCAGVGGPITGKGADLLLVDDYFKNAEQAISPVVRSNIWEWWNSTAYTRLEPGAKVVVIATRWHEDGLIGKLQTEFEGEKIRVVKLPAISLGPEKDYLGRPEGSPLWPSRYNLEALDRIRRSLDIYWWNSLYQQDPSGYGAAEWPSDYFGPGLYYRARPLVFEHRVMAIDASLGKSKKSDYSAPICTCLSGGKLFISGSVLRLPIEALCDKIIDDYLELDIEAIGVESNAFQELIGPILQLKARERGLGPLPIHLINNTVNKEIRIRRLGPYLANNLLLLDPSPSLALLVKQLKEFPNSEYDDGPDALEMSIRLMQHITRHSLIEDTPVEV